MKWKLPEYKQYRIKKTFAILPESMDCRTRVWLEFYYRVDRYRSMWMLDAQFLTLEEAQSYVNQYEHTCKTKTDFPKKPELPHW